MNLEINSSLKLVCNVIKSSIERQDSAQRFEFLNLLNSLNGNERYLVAKFFLKLTWNIGSLHVLGALHQLRILTATEFILGYENLEEIQLILNDFLESEHDLLTNLLINCTFDSSKSMRLNSIIDECLKNLFNDLLEKPNLNDLSYLSNITSKVPNDLSRKIAYKHVDVVLRLHESNVKEAFRYFSAWINEGVDELKFPKDLHMKLLHIHFEESLRYILEQSASDNFKNWKFYLILLQTLSSSNNEFAGPYLRKYLQNYLKQCSAKPSKHAIIHLLLTARASTACTLDIEKNLNNYAEWFKRNIGEMKIILNAEQFQNVLQKLEQCIDYEMEEDYLDIHATCYISPPILCAKMVQSYKSKCKLRLQNIKKGIANEQNNLHESIVIEDSN